MLLANGKIPPTLFLQNCRLAKSRIDFNRILRFQAAEGVDGADAMRRQRDFCVSGE